jgi:hypothetical protein
MHLCYVVIVKRLVVCLNSQLFGDDDPDEDVSPDTADPEAAGV